MLIPGKILKPTVMNVKKIFLPIVGLVLWFIILIANILIVLIILRKRQLWRVRFYIIANLAVADIIALVFFVVGDISTLIDRRIFFPLTMNTFFVLSRILFVASNVNSALATAFLATDRYIAVQYSLRYKLILTTKKTVLVLIFAWVLSFTLSGINWINTSTYLDYRRKIFATFTAIRVIVSVILLTQSKYTNIIRKRHMKEILRRNENFGAAKEKLDVLSALKKSLGESFKLYVATVFVMIAATVTGLADILQFPNNDLLKVHRFIMVFLYAIDIIVLVLSQGDIRKALTRVFFKFCQNRVEPL